MRRSVVARVVARVEEPGVAARQTMNKRRALLPLFAVVPLASSVPPVPLVPLVLLTSLVMMGCGSDGSGNDHAPGGASGSGHGSGGAAASAGAGATSSSGAGGAAGSNTGGTGGVAGSDGAGGLGRSTVAEFMGVNGFIDDELDQLAAVGNVREYHNWAWNDGNGAADYPGYPNNELEFSLWNGFWDFDAYYTGLAERGVTALPCLQGSVDYLGGALPPVQSGASITDPASYAAHASFMFQYAARYGSREVPASKLKLKAGQTARSGLKLVSYFENGNEPDADWINADKSPLFSPAATAAMSSADYDGHRGALGDGFGVKTADPAATLVLAGLAGAGPSDWTTNVRTYLDGMRAWSDEHRAGSFPADVLNVHLYCFGPDPFGTTDPRPGLAPEPCNLEQSLRDIASYRDQHLPGKPIWLTEFGYDTDVRSRLRAPAIGDSSAEQVQGQWLVRSYLALLAAGIDRAFVYVSRDACTGAEAECAVQFATAGVWTKEERPKVAWYYLATFRSRLGSMRWVTRVDSGHEDVSIAHLQDDESMAYVVWAPSSTGVRVENYALTMPAGATDVRTVHFADDSTTGVEAPATLSDGRVTLAVTETPVLVLARQAR